MCVYILFYTHYWFCFSSEVSAPSWARAKPFLKIWTSCQSLHCEKQNLEWGVPSEVCAWGLVLSVQPRGTILLNLHLFPFKQRNLHSWKEINMKRVIDFGSKYVPYTIANPKKEGNTVYESMDLVGIEWSELNRQRKKYFMISVTSMQNLKKKKKKVKHIETKKKKVVAKVSELREIRRSCTNFQL